LTSDYQSFKNNDLSLGGVPAGFLEKSGEGVEKGGFYNPRHKIIQG
jgi:hypothetical protein